VNECKPLPRGSTSILAGMPRWFRRYTAHDIVADSWQQRLRLPPGLASALRRPADAAAPPPAPPPCWPAASPACPSGLQKYVFCLCPAALPAALPALLLPLPCPGRRRCERSGATQGELVLGRVETHPPHARPLGRGDAELGPRECGLFWYCNRIYPFMCQDYWETHGSAGVTTRALPCYAASVSESGVGRRHAHRSVVVRMPSRAPITC
jgi:hypothetical protein